MGWLLANLFLFAVVLIGAGVSALGAYLLSHINPDSIWSTTLTVSLCAACVVGTYYGALFLWRVIGRFVNRA